MARISFFFPVPGWDPNFGFVESTTEQTTTTDSNGATVTTVTETTQRTTWAFPFESWAEKLIIINSVLTTTKTTGAGPTTTIEKVDGPFTAILEGKFRFFDDTKPYVKSGVVSKISYLYNNGSYLIATDFAEDVHTILAFISANDNLGLIDYLMGGSDTIQLSAGADYLHTHAGNDTIKCGAGDDTVFGEEGNDTFWGHGGNDTLHGGVGLDTACFTGTRAQYTVTLQGPGTAVVSGPEGIDTCTDIERLVFSDLALALDIHGKPAQAFRLYQAAFDRTPDLSGLGYWIAQLDGGMDLTEAAARFVDSAEFRAMYGTDPSNHEFLTTLYQHVLHRAPDPAGLAWWEETMATDPSRTKARVLAEFSESPENILQVQGLIAGSIAYLPWA